MFAHYRLVVSRLLLVAIIVVFAAGASCFGIGDETPCSPTDPSCGGVPPSSLPQARTLTVPYIGQRTPVWCWAATSTMVLQYYGVQVDQCQIVTTYLQRDCCFFGVGDQFCGVTASLSTMQAAMQYGGVRSTYVPSPLTFDQIVNEIGAGRPIIMAYRGSFSGHVVVLVGYNRANQTLVIYDPFYGPVTVPYGASFKYSGELVWVESLVGLSR